MPVKPELNKYNLKNTQTTKNRKFSCFQVRNNEDFSLAIITAFKKNKKKLLSFLVRVCDTEFKCDDYDSTLKSLSVFLSLFV